MSRSVSAVCGCPAGTLPPGHTRSPPVSFDTEAAHLQFHMRRYPLNSKLPCHHVTVPLILLVVCLFAFGPTLTSAEAKKNGYLFETVSSAGATVRAKGMFSRYKLWPSTYSSVERMCANMGGMKRHAAMLASPHDWLSLHVEPPEDGVLWGQVTEFELVTAAGETLYGGPVLLTDSPAEREVFDARARSVMLKPEGGQYGRSSLGYVLVAVGFPENSLQAKHGKYWAEFDEPVQFTVTEQEGKR